MKTKILILTLFILSVFKANAASDSYIPFGQYGFSCGTYTTESYQEYIGETVVYIPSHNQSSYRDKEFIRLNGKFNTPYIITNIK